MVKKQNKDITKNIFSKGSKEIELRKKREPHLNY